MLAETHARRVPQSELAWGSTAEWFTHLAGTHRGDGHRTVRQAETLVTERTATHEAMLAGRVSPEQAAVIVDAVDKLPLDSDTRERGEAVLLEEATRLNATDLAKAAKHLVEVADPERAERKAEQDLDRADRAAHHGRFLSIVEDGAGGVRFRGRGTVEDAAVLKAALLPLTKPQPALDPPTHCRRAPTRVTTAPGCGTPSSRSPSTPSPPTSRRTATAPAPASRSPPASTCSSRRSTGPPSGSATSITEDGLELSPATVRRLACDADLIPIALGSHGEVLDVGRTHRLVTPAIWRALVCRDAHCAFPGCTRPPIMCHAHHITHWADGGDTSLANMAGLDHACGRVRRGVDSSRHSSRRWSSDGRGGRWLPAS